MVRRRLAPGEVDSEGRYDTLRSHSSNLGRALSGSRVPDAESESWASSILNAWPGDYEIRRQNGYFRVTLFEPSYEHIGSAAARPEAIYAAVGKAIRSFNERIGQHG